MVSFMDSFTGSFEAHDVPRDGNCFYAALSLALGGFDRSAIWSGEEVRAVKRRMRRLLEALEEGAPETAELRLDPDVAQRLDSDGAWAEAAEVLLAARLFDARIRVFVARPGHPPLLGLVSPAPASRTICLLLARDHYLALREREPCCGLAGLLPWQGK